MTDKIVILSTCPSREEADRIARHLVESELAACVNLLPGVKSVYRWQGKVDESEEVLLVIKSRRDLFPLIERELVRIHTYEVPEAIVLSIVDGSEGYLKWLEQELRP